MRYLHAIPMKHLLAIVLAVFVSVSTVSAFAEQRVNGYYRHNGTYVQPYYRSSPNDTVRDNYSYRGNVNPRTDEVGKNRYLHDKTSPNYQGPDSHGRVGHNSVSNQPDAPRLWVPTPDGGKWVPMRPWKSH